MEIKIPAFPVLDPLSQATGNTLAPINFLPTDFLEIDAVVDPDDLKSDHFIVQAVCLKKCEGNLLPSVDDAANAPYVTTPGGAFYKDDAHYFYPSFNASSVWYSRIPERSQKGFGKYKLAGTDFTALIIHHVWPHHKLIFKSEEASLLYTYLLRRFYAQSKSATIAAEFKLNGHLPAMPKDFIEHLTLPLTAYQKAALLISLNNSAYALFMEQGTGKTPVVVNRVSLESARKRAKYNKMYRALIICPQQVRINWEREFQRFSTVPGKTGVMRGGLMSKLRTLTDCINAEDDCAWSAAIISIDSVNSIWDAMKYVQWDLVIIDESHKVKNPDTGRYKAVMKLDDRRATAKMILTGTPITNTVFDLWAQFEWLGKGLSGFSTLQNFRAFHGKWKESMQEGTGVRKLIGFKNTALIQERLARIAFLFQKKDMAAHLLMRGECYKLKHKAEIETLMLPEKVYDLCEITMDPKQAELYKTVATKLVAEIDEILADAAAVGKNITVEHILTRLIRLAQICSGHIKTDDMEDLENDRMIRGEVLQISKKNPKVEMVIKLIKEDWEADPNSKCIIWACFVEDIRVISERLAKEGMNHVGYHKTMQKQYRVKDSAAAEDVLNCDDTCRILLANPASAGIGQNYLGYDVDRPEDSSMYVNHHIYVSCNWSAVDRIQSEDRSHRRGTRANLRITDVIVPYTIDEEIRDRVKDKRKMAMTIQDIRNILNSVLKGYRK